MKLTELTDEQKNRWIAEKLGSKKCYGGRGNEILCDFLHDPAMRDLLQEKLLDRGVVIHKSSAGYYTFSWIWMNGTVTMWKTITQNMDLGIGVVDAFMLEGGYKED